MSRSLQCPVGAVCEKGGAKVPRGVLRQGFVSPGFDSVFISGIGALLFNFLKFDFPPTTRLEFHEH